MSLTGVQDRPGAVPAKAGLAASITRHPLVAYFTLAFAGTWILFVPILLSGRGLGLISIPDAAGLILFVVSTYAGPFLAALIVTRILDGSIGLHAWFRRMVQWRAGIRWYLLVLLGYPIVFGLPALLQLGASGVGAVAHNWSSFLASYIAAIPVGFFLPTLGEESGWRGFALPRLQKAYGPLVGSLVLGVLHAAWHLPAYFVKGAITATGAFDPVLFIANSLAIIATTFVWTWLFNHTAGSILFATYVHAASNAMSGALPKALNITSPDPWFAFEVSAVVALLVIAATRGRLGYSRDEPQSSAS